MRLAADTELYYAGAGPVEKGRQESITLFEMEEEEEEEGEEEEKEKDLGRDC